MLIRALGNLTLDGSDFPYPKLLLLLTYLSLEGAQQRRRVAQLFWPGASDPRNRLSVSLGRIEKALPGVLDCDRELVATTLQTDVALVRAAMTQARHADAVAAYAGRFLNGLALTGFGEELAEWISGTTDELARLVQHAHLGLAEALAGEERFARAAAHAETALDVGGLALLDPADMGRFHTVLVAGGSPRAALVRAETAPFELDLARSQAQARSRLRVAAHEPAPPGTEPLVGEAGRDAGAGGPPLIGRGAELEELANSLRSPERRLVTLIGPGGIGKSRLALAAAARAESRLGYTGGAVVVRLESVPTPAELPAVLADAVGLIGGVADRPGEWPLAALADWLGTDRHLLVLDNFEHLLGATDQLRELLARCPGVQLLVTSREPLGVAEEWQVLVEGLRFPPETESVEAGAATTDSEPSLDAWPALRLFEMCGRRVSHRFAVDASNVRHVAAICRACAGSPLAIELAASWVDAMAPAEIAAELARSIDLLDDRQRAASVRHRSIRAVFSSSWQQLSAPERTLFRRLAVFHGGFELSAAQAVAAAELATLASLVRKSFLVRDAGGRYYRHPLLRQLAVEKLAEEPAHQQEMLARHADHMRHVALQAHAHLMDPANSVWRARLEAELPNLAAALGWAEEQRDARLALDIVEALSEFWIWRGQVDEARRWAGSVAQLGARASDPLRYLKVTTRNVFLAAVTGDHSSALGWHGEAVALARELGSLADEARLWSHRGVMATYQCDYVAAAGFYETALQLATQVGDHDVMARVLNNLGDVNLFQSRYDQAQEHYVRSLGLERALGNKQMESNVLGSLAMTELHRGDAEAAERLLRESAALVHSLGITFSLPTALEQFAELASCVQRWSEGVRLTASAAALRESLRLPLEPFAQPAQRARLLAADRALGPAAVAEAWAQGGAWPAERALSWAVTTGFVGVVRPSAAGDEGARLAR